MRLTDYQETYKEAVIQKNLLINQRENAAKRIVELERLSQILERATAYIQVKAQETQNQLSIKIEDLVQLGIETCFPGEFIFKLEFKPNGRGRTDADLILIQEGWPVDPLISCGSGVACIEGFGLRIASQTLQQNSKVLLMEEPFKDINGQETREAACKVIQEISRELGIQFIINTGSHYSDLVNVADRIFDVSIKQGVSSVSVRK